MRYLFIIILAITLGFTKTNAQGCVAIRSTGGTCTMDHPGEMGEMSTSSSWILNVNNRYFKSFRHFVGTTEQKHRIAEGTEVINHAYTLDLALTRVLNNRWSIAVDLPINANKRSSLYEHGGKSRHTTNSFGVGDIRFATYAWLLNPAKSTRGNVQLGLGIKLPTGDFRYQDYFYTT